MILIQVCLAPAAAVATIILGPEDAKLLPVLL